MTAGRSHALCALTRAAFLPLLAVLAACGAPQSLPDAGDARLDDSARDISTPDAPPLDVASTDTPPADAPALDAPVPPADAPSADAPAADAPSPPRDAPAGPSHWVSGYYVGYQRDLYPPDAIDFAALTHVMMGAILPRADGTLDTTFYLDPTNGPALARQVATLAHARGRRAVLMIGGAGVHAGWVGAASAANRAAFVRNLVAAMTSLGYDGLDLDWEPLDAADEPNFRALAMALRAAAPSMVLTVPVGYVNSNAPTVSTVFRDVAPLFDQINIMSYEMTGAYPGWQSWHSSAVTGESSSTPTSIDSSVRAYLAAGVPAAKLGIGIGFYGVCYTAPVTAPRQALGGSTIVASDNTMSYANIMGRYYSMPAYHYDTAAQAPYLSFATAHGPQNCTYVSYEDPTSVAAKGRYVAMHGLGGAIIWTINQGYLASAPAGMRDPLMEAVRTAFMP